jgi:hypothetical protein
MCQRSQLRLLPLITPGYITTLTEYGLVRFIDVVWYCITEGTEYTVHAKDNHQYIQMYFTPCVSQKSRKILIKM